MKVCLFLALLLVGTGVMGQSVSGSSAGGDRMRALKTFRVEAGDLVTVLREETQLNKAALLSSVRGTIVAELESRGYSLTEDSTSAQMVVSFVGEVIERIDTEDMGPLGQEPATTGADLNRSQVWSRESRQGSVQIQVADPEGEMLWRGKSTIEFGTFEIAEVLNAAALRALRKVPRNKK